MNRAEKQTAYEIGREYSTKLNEMVKAYEWLTEKPISADDHAFWEQREVNKTKTLAAFWWQIGRYSDPFYYEDNYSNDGLEDYYEEN